MSLLLAVALLAAAVPFAHSQTCTSTNVQLTSAAATATFNTLNCQTLPGSVTISLPILTQAQTFAFNSITTINGDLSINLLDTTYQHPLSISFPNLATVQGDLSVITQGKVTRISFDVLTKVGGVVLLKTTGETNEIVVLDRTKTTGRLAVGGTITVKTTETNTGALQSVVFGRLVSAVGIYVQPVSAPIVSVVVYGDGLNLTQSLSLQSSESSGAGYLASATVSGLANVYSVDLLYKASYIKTITLNGTNFNVAGQLRIASSTSSGEFNPTIKISGLARAGSVVVEGNANPIPLVEIVGSALNVTGALTVRTMPSNNGKLTNVTVVGIAYLGSFDVSPSASDIIGVTLKAATSFAIGGDLILATSASQASRIGSVTIVGLVGVAGILKISSDSSSIGPVSINDAALTCTNSEFKVGGDLILTTSTSSSGGLGDVTIYGLTAIQGKASISSVASAINDVRISGSKSGACTPLTIVKDLSITTSPSSSSSIGRVTLPHIAGIGGNVLLSSDAGYLDGIIELGSLDPVGLYINGSLTITTSPSSSGKINNVTLSTVSSIGGAVSIWSGASPVVNVRIVGGANMATFKSSLSIKTDTAASASIGSVLISRIALINGAVSIYTPAGNIEAVHINGTSAAPLVMGGLDVSTWYTSRVLLGCVSTINGGVTLFGGNSNTHPVTINAPDSTGNSPMLTITGDVIIGSPNSALSSPGPINFNQVSTIGGKVLINLRDTVSNPSGIFFNGAQSYLTVGKRFDVISYAQWTAQSVQINNLHELQGEGFGNGKIYFDAYKTNTAIGTVSVNGKSIRSIDSAPYNTADNSLASDPNCINYCKGRGMAPASATSCNVCECFLGWSGSSCSVSTVCQLFPTCGCFCNSWSAWSTVTVGQTATTRTRTCAGVPSTIACSNVELQGTIECNAQQFQFAPATPSTFRVCNPLRVCNIMYEYQTVAPTLTSNRQCDNVRNCTSTEFQTSAPNATTNRNCAPLRVCNLAYEYQTVASTLTTNRQCASVRNCTTLEYQTVAPTVTVNRECATLRVCDLTYEFQTVAPTPTSNRQCDTVRNCTSSEYQTASPTSSTSRSCTPLRVCNPAYEYQSVAATLTTNRQCANLRNCTTLEYQTVAPTATTNRECTVARVCNAATEYQVTAPTTSTNRDCAPLRVCNLAYEYQSVAPTPSSNRQCDNLRNCTTTEYQTVAPAATINRECATLRECDIKGEYEAAAPTLTSNRDCKTISECTPEEYEAAAPTATTNRKCLPLTPECDYSFQFEEQSASLTANRVCEYITSCNDGQYEKHTPTTSTDRVCETITTCLSTEYETAAPTSTSNRECKKIDSCEGEIVWLEATATSDRVCIEDECAEGPCKNGGTCVNTPAGPSCSCAPGFYGEECEDNPCDEHACKNEATCNAVGTDYKCVCATGFTGEKCDTTTTINACAVNPCKNNGVCYSPQPGVAACSCKPGFEGTTCESLVKTACSNVVCQNGGQCIVTPSVSSGYVCSCSSAYYGTFCQYPVNACLRTVAPCKNGASCLPVGIGGVSCTCTGVFYGSDCSLSQCSPSPCLNGGVCSTNTTTSYTCTCPDDYTGGNCNKLQCTSSYCQNGGTCALVDSRTRVCVCPAGTSGDYCQIRAGVVKPPEASTAASSSTPIIAGIAAGAALLVLIVILVLARRRRERKPPVATMPEESRFISFENPNVSEGIASVYSTPFNGPELYSDPAVQFNYSEPTVENNYLDPVTGNRNSSVYQEIDEKALLRGAQARLVPAEGDVTYDLGDAPPQPEANYALANATGEPSLYETPNESPCYALASNPPTNNAQPRSRPVSKSFPAADESPYYAIASNDAPAKPKPLPRPKPQQEANYAVANTEESPYYAVASGPAAADENTYALASHNGAADENTYALASHNGADNTYALASHNAPDAMYALASHTGTESPPYGFEAEYALASNTNSPGSVTPAPRPSESSTLGYLSIDA